jgi:hypothetical protein
MQGTQNLLLIPNTSLNTFMLCLIGYSRYQSLYVPYRGGGAIANLEWPKSINVGIMD